MIMSWKTLERVTPAFDSKAPPVLSEAVREKIRFFFDRYEQKRAVLLPALHIVQDALGSLSWQAMAEIAELLEIAPSEVIDTVSFYTHYWTHPKGEKLIMACRSLSCEMLGGAEVLDALKEQLGIEEHGTTPDGKFSLVTEECLACCDHGPCLLINEKLHKRVKAEDVERILADQHNDVIDMVRSDLYDSPHGGSDGAEERDAKLETTSDVQEMRDAR